LISLNNLDVKIFVKIENRSHLTNTPRDALEAKGWVSFSATF
jgi:hypothetical protein